MGPEGSMKGGNVPGNLRMEYKIWCGENVLKNLVRKKIIFWPPRGSINGGKG